MSRDDRLVLVIDDEAPIRRAVRTALEEEGLRVIEAATAQQGLKVVVAARPALIVLDLRLPDRSGLVLCRELRAWYSAPIIVLSARDFESEKVALLDAGADDYMTKPFGTSELRARVRAQLRRAEATVVPGASTLEIGDLQIDLTARVVTRAGTEVHPTPIEWELLRTFLRYAGRTLTHGQLFSHVWPGSSGNAQSYLRVHVANLRRRLETDPFRPVLMVTEPGVGYRFRAIEPV